MQPTYSLSEIKSLVRSLDFASLSILIDLVEEEKEGYSLPELKAIDKFMRLKHADYIRNEVNPEFLLSFN
jgi:hypothetical protein